MLHKKDLTSMDTVLVDDATTGTRAAMIKGGAVYIWNTCFSRDLVEKTVGRKLDWSPVCQNRYARPHFGTAQ